MPIHEDLLAELGKVPRQGDDIPDLPAVELDLGQLIDVELEIVNVGALLGAGQHLDEVAPDLDPLLLVEVVVADGEVDAGFKGFVDGTDSVGCQDDDAVVVF